MVDVASSLEPMLPRQRLNDELREVRRALYQDLGIPFPGIHLRFNERIDAHSYLILLQEVPVAPGELKPGQVMVEETTANLDLFGIPFVRGKGFTVGKEAVWVEETHLPSLAQNGVPHRDLCRTLTYHLSMVLRRYGSDFLGLQETKFLLDKMEAHFPEIVREVQRILPLQKIAEVLQRLVQEEICIRDLRTIMQALIEWGQREKDTVLLVEYVRSSLKRYISHKYSQGRNALAVYLFEPEVEETIRRAIRQTSGGSYLALEPDTARKIVRAVRAEAGEIGTFRERPVLLVSMDIRRYVRKLIEQELYELPVLSYQELTEDVTIQPLGRIRG
jgi:type III secretion protein V